MLRLYIPANMRVSGTGLGVACAVFAILMVIAVATEVFLRTDVHPRTKFRSIAVTTLFAGLTASVLIERMDLHILDN